MLSMVKGGGLPILIFLFTFTIASAQEHSRKTLLPHLWEDQKRIWTSPVAPLILLGIFAASFSLDGAPSRDLRRDGRFQDFNESFNSTPSHLVLAGFPLLVLATGKTVRNQDLIEGGWIFSEATLNGLPRAERHHSTIATTHWKRIWILERRQLLPFRPRCCGLVFSCRDISALQGGEVGTVDRLSIGWSSKLFTSLFGQPFRLRCRDRFCSRIPDRKICCSLAVRSGSCVELCTINLWLLASTRRS